MKKATEAQLEFIMALLERTQTDPDEILEGYGVEDLADLTVSQQIGGHHG